VRCAVKRIEADAGRLFLVLLLLALQGCGALSIRSHVPSPTPGEAYKVGEVVELATGERITFQEMIRDLEAARVVYVGETHVSRADHALQLKVARALLERHPQLAIGVEMVPRTLQPVLDRWVKGLLSEEDLLEELAWEETWGHDFALYRPLFQLTRDHRLPMVALNAPGDLVRKVARDGLAGLDARERSQLAVRFLDDDPRHRAFVEEEFRSHAHGGFENFQHFYEAQLAWDETMAETLAQWLRDHADFQVLVLAGKGHVNYRFGVPERTKRRLEHRYAIVVPMPVHDTALQVSPEIGDYLVVTEKERPFPGHGLRLGIVLDREKTESGLYVKAVLPGSRAARSGLKPGDRIVAVDGRTIGDIRELHEVVRGGGGRRTFTVERRGNRTDVVIDLD
jgi:uncharacterized iron-regulated protein